MSETLITFRAQAKALGQKRYFTGKPCRNGHLTTRLVSNGTCYGCIKQHQKDHPDRHVKHKRRYYDNHKATCKLNSRRFHLKQFGLTIEEYSAKLAAQDGKCSICSLPLDSSNKISIPNVDHNHSTGQTRDLLCGNCNSFIGMAKESPAILKAGIQYLRRHNASAV